VVGATTTSGPTSESSSTDSTAGWCGESGRTGSANGAAAVGQRCQLLSCFRPSMILCTTLGLVKCGQVFILLFSLIKFLSNVADKVEAEIGVFLFIFVVEIPIS
jgi:hypothetical protein